MAASPYGTLGNPAASPDRWKVLHLTWIAFFLSFLVWFNFAPFAITLMGELGLSAAQVKSLFIANVALTVPARIVIGALVDRFGPRRVFSALLATMSLPCFAFALADSYWQLVVCRLVLSGIGAGFVVGIRMVGEWFPCEEIGLAEGIYGGWGNFGSAAGAFALPVLAAGATVLVDQAHGWRVAVALTGLMSLIWSFVYLRMINPETPLGKPHRAKSPGVGLNVFSAGDALAHVAMVAPLYLSVGLLVWKLQEFALLPSNVDLVFYVGLALFYAWQCRRNLASQPAREVPRDDTSGGFAFRQVAILNVAYLTTFGSELGIVSMLPQFFEETFGLSVSKAGFIAGSFALMNLFARPMGGVLSDRLGRRRTLTILLMGATLGYTGMASMAPDWSLLAAVVVTMTCSFFVQASEGAVFSMVPLVHPPQTGKIAGMVGAYGNVGAVLFLTVLSFVSPPMFFLTIAVVAGLSVLLCAKLDEPRSVPTPATDSQGKLAGPASVEEIEGALS